MARALGYFADERNAKRYSISPPWRPLAGAAYMVCAREDVPDGRGGWAPSSNYSMFAIDEGGAILNMAKDQSLTGCPNRDYGPFQPIPR